MRRYSLFFLITMIYLVPIATAHALQWNGTIEIETAAILQNQGSAESDITLAKTELGLSHSLASNMDMNIILLHEDDDTEAAHIETATVHMQLADVSILSGRQYVPFGRYDSMMVNDPLTKEIGETREAAMGLSGKLGLLNLGGFVYKGDIVKTDQAWAPDWTLNTAIQFNPSTSIQLYYINNISNSENLTVAISSGAVETADIAATGVALNAGFKNNTLAAECLTALSAYSNNETPMACHFESARKWGNTRIGAAWQITRGTSVLNLAKSRMSLASSVLLNPHAAFNLEWSYDTQPDNTVTNMTLAQLAYTF